MNIQFRVCAVNQYWNITDICLNESGLVLNSAQIRNAEETTIINAWILAKTIYQMLENIGTALYANRMRNFFL